MRSELGLGTLQAGDRFSKRQRIAPSEYKRVLSHALRMGIRSFDTAYSYFDAETMLGSVIRELGIERESVDITDKIMPLPTFRKKAETSLKRLKTEYFDALLIHWPTEDEKLLYSTLKELEKLKSECKTKSFGVSNFPQSLIGKLRKDFEITISERALSLIWPDKVSEGITEYGYSPLASGLLVGKSANLYPEEEEYKDLFSSLMATVGEIARAHGTTNGCVALSWALSQGAGKVFFGASKTVHADDATKAKGLILSGDEDQRLRLKAEALRKACPFDNVYRHDWG